MDQIGWWGRVRESEGLVFALVASFSSSVPHVWGLKVGQCWTGLPVPTLVVVANSSLIRAMSGACFVQVVRTTRGTSQTLNKYFVNKLIRCEESCSTLPQLGSLVSVTGNKSPIPASCVKDIDHGHACDMRALCQRIENPKAMASTAPPKAASPLELLESSAVTT